MNRKTPANRISKPREKAGVADHEWHRGAYTELYLYSRSLQKAAKTLLENLNLEPDPKLAWDACPVILLCRQAVELNLKALVGAGRHFLPSPTDSITLFKTHSLRWLAQIVCQILRAVKWESDFTCDGVASLAEFSAVVDELEELDPVWRAVRSAGRDGSVPRQLEPINVVRFAHRLDGLLGLLSVTADALTAIRGHHTGTIAAEPEYHASDFKPTIH